MERTSPVFLKLSAFAASCLSLLNESISFFRFVMVMTLLRVLSVEWCYDYCTIGSLPQQIISGYWFPPQFPPQPRLCWVVCGRIEMQILVLYFDHSVQKHTQLTAWLVFKSCFPHQAKPLVNQGVSPFFCLQKRALKTIMKTIDLTPGFGYLKFAEIF